MMKYNPFSNGCPPVEKALEAFARDGMERQEVLGAISSAVDASVEVLVPYYTPQKDLGTIHPRIMLRTVSDETGSWLPVFTNHTEYENGPESLVMPQMLSDLMKSVLQGSCTGIVLNPWGNEIRLMAEEIQLILGRTAASVAALADVTEGDRILAEAPEERKRAIRYYLRAYEAALQDRDIMIFPLVCRRVHSFCADYFSPAELAEIPNPTTDAVEG